MSTDACASLVDVAYLYSQLPLNSNRNDRPVQSLLLLLDAAVAVASAIDDNILEALQPLPVDDQNKIKSRLDKIAEKTTQPPILMSNSDTADNGRGSSRQEGRMTNLKAILHPAYEPGNGSVDGAQLVDGEWWHPIFGCDSLQNVVDNVRSMLQLPPNYIDPEHQGQDRELLQAFYQACNAEGGTADDIHLRGIKAALATLQTALPVPSAPVHEAPIINNTGHANQRSFKDINVVIDGIDYDKDDPNVSWWFTPNGSIRGRIRLRELRDLIQRHLDRVEMPEPFPVDLAALHDPDFSDGLSPIEHLNRLSGVAPSRPVLLPTEEEIATWLRLKVDSPVYLAEPDQPEDDGPAYWAERVPLIILEALKQWGQVAPASAQPAALAQPAEVHQLTPKEVEAQECFTALRDEILNLNDGLEVNEVLHIIDNNTPEWV